MIKIVTTGILILLFSPPVAASQDERSPRQLEQGKTIDREIAPGQAHSYQLALSAGQYLFLTVSQRGIDVTAAFFGPDGIKIAEANRAKSAQGQEVISLITEQAGTYRLAVEPSQKEAAQGRYEVEIEEARAATPLDPIRLKGQRAYVEADQLSSQTSAEARRQAIEKYQEALALFREAKDRKREASTLNDIGETYRADGDHKKAVEFYNQSLEVCRAIGERKGEARVLYGLGVAHTSMNERQKAIDYYNQAIEVNRAIGDEKNEAVALNNIGDIYRTANEGRKALEYFTRSLALIRKGQDQRAEIVTLNNIGIAHRGLGEFQKALEHYNQALEISRAIGEKARELSSLNNIALLYDSRDDRDKALEYYNQVVSLARTLKDRRREANTLNQMGEVYRKRGENQKAIEYYDQSLRLFKESSDRVGEGAVLHNTALVYRVWGDLQKALDTYSTALALFRAASDRRLEAGTLINMGQVYFYLGDARKALEYYNQALPIFKEIRERRREGVTLNFIGQAYDYLREYDKALEHFNQALPIMREFRNRQGESAALNNLGEAHRKLGNREKAMEFYNQALSVGQASNDPRMEALAYLSLGKNYDPASEVEKAIDSFNRALPMLRMIGDRAAEADALFSISRAERSRGNLDKARSNVEASLEIIESMRRQVGSQDLRATFSAAVQDYYTFYIDLLMELDRRRTGEGFGAAALQASERGRARSLVELLTESGADIRQGVEPALLDRERDLFKQINAGAERLTDHVINKRTQQAAAVKKEIDDLRTEYNQLLAQIRASSPRYAALTQPRPLSLKEIQQQLLDPNTLLLEYSLGEERSFLWVVSQTSLRSFELPKRAEIEAAARKLYDRLTARNSFVKGESKDQKLARIARADSELPRVAAALTRMALAPAAGLLRNKRLLVVADGALQYIPFAALPDPRPAAAGRPLAFTHEILSLPSASALAALRREISGRKPAPKSIAVLADPVFDREDPRVSSNSALVAKTSQQKSQAEPVARILAQEEGDPSVAAGRLRIQRLPFTRHEARRILALAPSDQTLEALDFNASRETATGRELANYRYVHFASHGYLDTERPELSAIVLSRVNESGEPQPQGGFLRAMDIFNLNLPVELVVLSACETGLGKQVKGEGLVGLTRGFMYAGAARVVVSLWSVNDRATAELMTGFYSRMMKQGMKPAAALKAAQIEMWRQKRWQSPYYWAAFTIQGEWR